MQDAFRNCGIGNTFIWLGLEEAIIYMYAVFYSLK